MSKRDPNEPGYIHVTLAAAAFHEMTGRHALKRDDVAVMNKIAARLQREMGPIQRGFAPVHRATGVTRLWGAAQMRGTVLKTLTKDFGAMDWRKWYRVRPILFFQEKR